MTNQNPNPNEICLMIRARLDDYLDDALEPCERAEVATHLEVCGECRAERDDLQRIVAAAAALPREATPEHDLWPEIAPRLVGRRAARPGRTLFLAALPLAAALLVTVTAVLVQRFPAGPSPTAAAAVDGADSIAAAEAEYERAARELTAALEAQRATLPPSTRATLERNLAVIDQALGDVRQALQRDPGNPAWARLLLDAERQRVEVLTQTRRLAGGL